MFARAGDYNAVFVREPCNLFDPSCVKVGLRGQVCIHCLGYLEARVASIINPLPENAVKCRVFLLIMQLLRNICDITMSGMRVGCKVSF